MAEEALFSHIRRLQGARPWGSVLDAGTGEHSLDWVSSLPTARWTAVTASPSRRDALRRKFGDRMRPQDRILAGNWTDPLFLHGEVHDAVLADYLLGAVDFFAPYFQDRLFRALRPRVGSSLYVVGLEPYPEEDTSQGACIIREIAALRDACIRLAGHRCYREYPLEWTVRNLEESGFTVEDARSFPIVYGRRFISGQLEVCERKIRHLRDGNVVLALEGAIADLRERALSLSKSQGGIRFGADYVVHARPTPGDGAAGEQKTRPS